MLYVGASVLLSVLGTVAGVALARQFLHFRHGS
jgi:hypothetical protein